MRLLDTERRGLRYSNSYSRRSLNACRLTDLMNARMQWGVLLSQGYGDIVRSELDLRNKWVIWRSNLNRENIPIPCQDTNKDTGVIIFTVLE